MTKKQLETYKNTYDRYDGIPNNEFDSICDELIKYKDYEEEIKCPLDVLEKGIKKFYEYDAINNRMLEYTDDDFENDRYARLEIVVNLNRQEILVIDYMDIADIDIRRFKLKDYKKTWWLKKDKSE